MGAVFSAFLLTGNITFY